MIELPKDIQAAAEAASAHHQINKSDFCGVDSKAHETYMTGWKQCYSHLLSKPAGGFDVAPLERAYHEEEIAPEWYTRKDFAAWGARYQHSLDAAQIAALQADNAKLHGRIKGLRAGLREIAAIDPPTDRINSRADFEMRNIARQTLERDGEK